MVPAHHLLELQLIGYPNPNPVTKRFFDPKPNRLPANVTEIGQQYAFALGRRMLGVRLDSIDGREPIGVMFSGGIDSGSILLVLYHLLLQRGENPARHSRPLRSQSVAGMGAMRHALASF